VRSKAWAVPLYFPIQLLAYYCAVMSLENRVCVTNSPLHAGLDLRRFQLIRQIAATDGGAPIDVIVDFLMPRDAEVVRNKPPLIDDLAVQRADGADLTMCFYQMVAVRGSMPGGGTNRVEIAVCSIPALLAIKGHAVNGRCKQKDAYDIYY
jgi:hypothetical protein